MDTFLKGLREIFAEDNGILSFMRVMSAFVISTITLVWAQHCIRTISWTPLDAGSVTAILGLAAAKVWQKSKEVEKP